MNDATMDEQADGQAWHQMMLEVMQRQVEALQRVVRGTATTEDARILAAGCGIDFKLIT